MGTVQGSKYNWVPIERRSPVNLRGWGEVAVEAAAFFTT